MVGKRGESLLNTMLFIELYTLNRAWDGLTDDELFWEPFVDSWGVRRRAECRTATPFGDGDWVADFDVGVVEAAIEGRAVEPLTTIGWLLWHIGSQPGRLVELDFLGGPYPTRSGWTSPYISAHPVFTSASEAVEAMRAGWRALDGALRTSSDEQLEQTTHFWSYGDAPPLPTFGAQVIASILNEVSHHGTQIGVLRDLYRATGGTTLQPSGG
jgi:hypothetical protein